GRGEADRHIAMQVAALAAEDRMRPDPHFHVQVARRTAILSRLAFAGEANAVAGVHAGGNLHRQGADFLLAAAAAAVRARFRDHGAGAMALGAGLLDGEETLLHADLAGAAAGAAGLRRAAGARARAAATVAGGHARHADLDGVAEDRLFQVEHHFVTQVGAAEDAPSAPPAAAAEDVAHVGAAEPATAETAGGGIETGMAELVIGGTLLRVGKHFIGFLDLLEVRLRFLVPRVAVRVILHGKTPVCLLQFGIRRVALYTQNLVVVPFAHRSS